MQEMFQGERIMAQEGHMLMWYADRNGKRERIWNSRNGITSFCISGRYPGDPEMSHVDWNLDTYAPNHVPDLGDRIFVNLTIIMAQEGRRKFTDENWDHPEFPMHSRYSTKEEAIKELAQRDFDSFAPNTPTVIVVTPVIQAIYHTLYIDQITEEVKEQLAIDAHKRRGE